MHEPIIVVKNLWRTYEATKGLWKTTRNHSDALRGISLEVTKGELFGLLGPNGAGKTTLIKILSTILLPSSGKVCIYGYDIQRDVNQVRKQIGIVFGGDRGFHSRLTARQNLRYWAAVYRMDDRTAQKRISELLELVGLSQRADERMENYSRGMKQRLHFARGLIHQPTILFLDEPSLGLDPVAALSMRNLIKNLQGQGVTIFMSTHDMQEAEALCDRVAIINDGNILLLDQPHIISQNASGYVEIEITFRSQKIDILREICQQSYVCSASMTEIGASKVLHARLVQEDAVSSLLMFLADNHITRVTTKESTLEDVYLQLLGDRKMFV